MKASSISTGLVVLALAAMLGFPVFAEGPPLLQAQAPVRPPGKPGPGPRPAVPPSYSPLPLSHACAPAEVITTKTLVRVQCRTALSIKGLEEVHLFAIGVEDPAFASRVLRVAMSAQIGGYQIKITFISSDLSGEPLGCPPKTCRLIETIGLLVN